MRIKHNPMLIPFYFSNHNANKERDLTSIKTRFLFFFLMKEKLPKDAKRNCKIHDLCPPLVMRGNDPKWIQKGQKFKVLGFGFKQHHCRVLIALISVVYLVSKMAFVCERYTI
jgi:hypothetical protein